MLTTSLSEVETAITTTLGASASALGWEGQITDRTAEVADPGLSTPR